MSKWPLIDVALIAVLFISASGFAYQVITRESTSPEKPAPVPQAPCLAPALNEQTHITLFHIDGELRIRCVTVSIIGRT